MKNKFVPARPEGWTRAWASGAVAMSMAAALSACGGGGGGGGGSPGTAQTLSADQKIYEDAALHGGVGSANDVVRVARCGATVCAPAVSGEAGSVVSVE